MSIQRCQRLIVIENNHCVPRTKLQVISFKIDGKIILLTYYNRKYFNSSNTESVHCISLSYYEIMVIIDARIGVHLTSKTT